MNALHIPIMATMIPTETLIEKLESAITDYKLGINKNAKEQLIVALQMTIINMMNDGDITKAFKMSEDINQMQERDKLFQTPKN